MQAIKRPSLTKKLLMRPPFRFLHDIVAEVVKSSGFMADVFSEHEMVIVPVRTRALMLAPGCREHYRQGRAHAIPAEGH